MAVPEYVLKTIEWSEHEAAEYDAKATSLRDLVAQLRAQFAIDLVVEAQPEKRTTQQAAVLVNTVRADDARVKQIRTRMKGRTDEELAQAVIAYLRVNRSALMMDIYAQVRGAHVTRLRTVVRAMAAKGAIEQVDGRFVLPKNGIQPSTPGPAVTAEKAKGATGDGLAAVRVQVMRKLKHGASCTLNDIYRDVKRENATVIPLEIESVVTDLVAVNAVRRIHVDGAEHRYQLLARTGKK